jgi:hypothetical protein
LLAAGVSYVVYANAHSRINSLDYFPLYENICLSYKTSLLARGEPLWLSGKVVKNEKINEIERTRVGSPPRATSFFKKACLLAIISIFLCVG